jgi:hypothetical protein
VTWLRGSVLVLASDTRPVGPPPGSAGDGQCPRFRRDEAEREEAMPFSSMIEAGPSRSFGAGVGDVLDSSRPFARRTRRRWMRSWAPSELYAGQTRPGGSEVDLEDEVDTRTS